MKKLSLLVAPLLSVALTSAIFNTTNRTRNTEASINNAPLKLNNPINETIIKNTRTSVTYSDFDAAINEAYSGDTLQLLTDVVNPDAESIKKTDTMLPIYDINKSLTITGKDDNNVKHNIVGYAFRVTDGTGPYTPATVNFKDMIVDGSKEHNDPDYFRDHNHYLFGVSNGSTLNFTGDIKIHDFKYRTKGMIFCHSKATVNVAPNDGDKFEVTDCATKFGLFYLDNDECYVNMYDGDIHDNYSCNKYNGEPQEGLIVYSSDPGACFTMYGGKIHDNVALASWEDPTHKIPRTNGTFYVKRNGKIILKGGEVYKNRVAYGGLAYTPNNDLGTIEVGGSLIAFENEGTTSDGTTFKSNIYLAANQKINLLSFTTDTAKIGVFTDDKPGEGYDRLISDTGSESDLAHLVSDDADYDIKYKDGQLYLYHYKPEEPRFTPPTIVIKDTLTYTGEPQCLVSKAGSVTKGGTMMYCTDYNGDISAAHWTSDINEVTGVDATDHNVTYYVTENSGAGTEASTPVTVTTNIIPNTSLTSSAIIDIKNQEYTGGQVRPTIVIKDGDKTLTEGTDYTVRYSNNTKIGTATVKVTLKGNYSGVIEKTFTIVPAVCIIHWFTLIVLLLGLGAYVFIYYTKRKNLYAYITCGAGVLITAVFAYFGGCSICLAFAITNVIVFVLGAGFMDFKRRKEEAKKENN